MQIHTYAHSESTVFDLTGKYEINSLTGKSNCKFCLPMDIQGEVRPRRENNVSLIFLML